MFNEGRIMTSGIEDNESPALRPVTERAILQDWDDIKYKAKSSKRAGRFPEDPQLHPEDPKKLNKWNRMELLKLVSETVTVLPEKRAEFEIDDAWEEVLQDMDEYRQQGEIDKYAELAFYIKQVWPEKFSETSFDEEIVTKIRQELTVKNANWRVWPNIFVIAKSLCPEILTDENSLSYKEDLINSAGNCYGKNWRNYLDILSDLKILFPEEVAKLLDKKSTDEILKVVSDEKYIISEKAAKAHIVLEN